MSDGAPVWPGPSLLVPITVDCLLVGEPDRTGTWAVTRINYQNLAKRLVPDAAPPFAPKPAAELLPAGAHLIWTLPFSLRHGQQQVSDGSVVFPTVPNRWLVVRAAYDIAGSPPAAPVLTAFAIEADALQTPPGGLTPGVSQYPGRDNPKTTMQIGKAVALQSWAGPTGPGTPFLSAVGPAEVSWAVAYDNVRNVFSFYDALGAPGTYGYSVIGWYADPAKDGLAGLAADTPANWIAALSKAGFDWTAGAAGDQAAVQRGADAWAAWAKAHGLDTGTFVASGVTVPKPLADAIAAWGGWQAAHGVAGAQPSFPRQTLLHGQLSQVVWEGASASYGTGAPGGGTTYPAVAVGNTGMEAISAWLATTFVKQSQGDPNTIPKIERFLEAFQKGLLVPLESDVAGVEAKLHAAEFGSTYGGSEWIVVRPGADGTPIGAAPAPPPFGGQQTLPLTGPQTQALIGLNALQVQRDALAANLVSRQSELFALFYKRGAASIDQRQPIIDATTAITAQITADQAQLTSLAASITESSQALTALLGNDYVLRQVSAPQVFTPYDPVVMVAGIKTDTKFAPPGAYDDETSLACRFTGQFVTGLDVQVAGDARFTPQTLTAADVLGAIALPAGQPIPKESQDLWLELLLLDTGAARFLASVYCAKCGIASPSSDDLATVTAAIQALQMAPWTAAEGAGASTQATAEAAGLAGVLPSSVGVSFRTGQPWSPIYLDWKAAWVPSAPDAGDPAAQLAEWKLGSIDYEWTGTSITMPSNAQIFQGRTVLNPKIAQDVGAALAQFKNDPDYASLDIDVITALEQVAAIMGRFDVMTQSMGGFTQQLITREVAPNQGDPAKAALLGSAPIGFRPVLAPQFANPAQFGATAPDSPFFPVRAGHFQLLEVWIVDSFGQILRGQDPRSPGPIPVIRANAVKTPGDANAGIVQVPPRIAQAARVTLQPVDAERDDVPSTSSDSTSPICGWIVPNHLDASLMVFDAAGASLGAVITTQTDVQDSGRSDLALRWDAPPGSSAALGAPPAIPNAHLLGVVRGLMTRGLTEGAAALDDLLAHIDSSLWAVAPLPPPDPNVAALLGAPLAVVRATLFMNLDGMPVYPQAFDLTGKYYVAPGPVYQPQPTPLLSVPFGVRIGDTVFPTNGVMGYFTDDDYSRFYAVYGAGGQTSSLLRALRAGTVPRGGVAALLRRTALAPPAPATDYVTMDHLVSVTPDATRVKVTLLVDPRGVIPVISGMSPMRTVALPPGPVSSATRAMKASFRVGPLLTDPSRIRMPLPAEVRGSWRWAARKDVTTWAPDAGVAAEDGAVRLGTTPLRLSEGWLTLAGALDV